MPNIKSSAKRVKIEAKRNLRNRIVKSRMRTGIKAFDAATADDQNLDELYRAAISLVDKAASKGVIHKNMSNRKKAQLAQAYNAKRA